MNVATSTTSTLDRASMFLGTAMMLAWTLGIGIVGFALLLAIAYAMVFHNYSLAIVFSFLLFAPLMLTIAWGILWAAEAAKKDCPCSAVFQHQAGGRHGRNIGYFIRRTFFKLI